MVTEHSGQTYLAALWRPAQARLASLRRVGFLLSSLLLFLSATLLVPLAVAASYGEAKATRAFIYTVLIGASAGVVGLFATRTDLSGMSRREGFAVVSLAWMMICVMGALPFYFSGSLAHFNDALFEAVSGFTGTGSSVIKDLRVIPRGVLFWRDFTHWLGGMGFIVLYIALFPLLGLGAMHLYRAETPGPEKDHLMPSIRSTAKTLWLIYVLFSVILTVLYLFGGMSWFDALCHMFAAMGTGGFSTHNESIGYFHSAYIDWVTIIFLWIAATNFTLHYYVLTGKPMRLLRDSEWRFFTGVIVLFSTIVTLVVWGTTSLSFTRSLRDSTFAVVSLISTTGFVTADYEKWVPITQFILFLCLFIGGMAGSTAGAMKAVRVQLLAKYAGRRVYRLIHPQEVSPVRLGSRAVSSEVMQGVLAFIGLYLGVYVFAVAGMSATGLDFATAMSAVATAMGGVGPGLARVGPTDVFTFIHPAGKLILDFCMLAGRLEIYTLILLVTPAFWRR
jgi:trk system potassium uptake protein TrkH